MCAMSAPEKIEAGLKSEVIDITPEMIEAGVREYALRFDPWFNEEDVVAKILRASLACRRHGSG